MFARITRYRMKPDSIAAATALLETLKPQIMALPGLLNFINVMNDDGNGYVVSVLESEDMANANLDQVQALWGQFADHLAEPPATGNFNVLMNEANG